MPEEDLSVYSQITEVKEGTKITKVVIVRHGESVANTEGKYQGQTYDTDLSELGKKQAHALAQRLKELDIKKIITSPLKRTHQTASRVGEVLSCEIEVNTHIIETNHGLWEGIHTDIVKQKFPDIFNKWRNSPLETVFPQGESFIETIKRTLDFLENTEFKNNTLVVTHDNILRAIISLVHNWDMNKMWEIPLETTSLNIFEVNRVNGKNLFRTISLNDTKHLKDLEKSTFKHAL